MSLYSNDADNINEEENVHIPPRPRTGQLKRGATSSEAQPQLKLSNSSSSGDGASGLGPYRSTSVGGNISHGRLSSLMHPQDVSSDQFKRRSSHAQEDEWHFSLPDRWSCPEKTSAGIVGGEFIVEDRTHTHTHTHVSCARISLTREVCLLFSSSYSFPIKTTALLQTKPVFDSSPQEWPVNAKQR